MRRWLVLCGAASALALALAGCDLGDRGDDLVNGKQLFTEQCGSCHVLERAATAGTIGPNLDVAFHRARVDGFPDSTIKGLVKAQIDEPRRGSEMPADLVTGEDAEDVAAYVAEVVARSGEDTGALADVGGGKPGGPPGRQVFVGPGGCGSCHTLSDAGTSGTSGPDLDEALAGQSTSSIRQSIVDPNAEIAEGFQPDVMPTDYGDQLSQQQLDDLVEYLADVAG